MYKKPVQITTMVLYRIVGSICISSIFCLGLFIYARSLFVEKTPIQKSNTISLDPVYTKGVVLVIDGVRADAIYNTSPEKRTKYHSNFTVLDEIPENDIFRAVSIADLPTGTAMRILSIFSGIPTTLLSAQRSFKNQSSGVDNFIAQMQRKGLSFLFYGDETWSYLFPEIKSNIGEMYHPYGLVPFTEEERLIDLALHAQNSNDFIILHLISPDSYGHAYGTDSAEVQRSLQMINKFIRHLYKALTDKSFIAVLSDHGVNDDGSHGGTSLKEKAASFMLIAKNLRSKSFSTEAEALYSDTQSTNNPDKNNVSSKAHSDSTIDKKKEESTCKNSTTAHTETAIYRKYKEEISQLNITEKTNIISQNDILPTLCALIGLPVPYNASGSLVAGAIPRERHAEICNWEIERQKRALIGLSHAINPEELDGILKEPSTDNLFRINELLGDKIHSLFHASSIPGMCIGAGTAVLGILMQWYVFRVDFLSFFLFISLAAISMIGHSVYSVIHEDVISLGLCLVLGRPLWSAWRRLLVFSAATFCVGEFPLHSVDRVWVIRWIKKIPNRSSHQFFEKTLFLSAVASIGAYWVARVAFKKRELHIEWIGAVLFAGSRFFSSGIACVSRSAVLIASPSFLPLILYAPSAGLVFLYVFCPIVTESISRISNTTQLGCFLFFLIKIMFFITGHNHALSSINWEAAFTFTKQTIPVISGALVLSDLLLPFFYVAYMLGQSNIQAMHTIVFLQAACAVIGWVVNFWFLGQSLMWFIFTGRTVFESFFLVVFSVVQAVMCACAPRYMKTASNSPNIPSVHLSSIASPYEKKPHDLMT